MSWSDDDWDDIVRKQPGTYWGEYAKGLEANPPIAPPPVEIPQGDPTYPGIDSSSYGGRRPRSEPMSLEEWLECIISIAGGLAGGYLVYLGGSAAELTDTNLVIACLLGFGASTMSVWMLLRSDAGKRFIAGLGWILRVVFVVTVFGLMIWAWFRILS